MLDLLLEILLRLWPRHDVLAAHAMLAIVGLASLAPRLAFADVDATRAEVAFLGVAHVVGVASCDAGSAPAPLVEIDVPGQQIPEAHVAKVAILGAALARVASSEGSSHRAWGKMSMDALGNLVASWAIFVHIECACTVGSMLDSPWKRVLWY